MRHALRLLAVLTVLAASLMAPVATSTPAQQADAADLRLFDPGNIISDAVFFDAWRWTPADPAFLNDKGAACVGRRDALPEELLDGDLQPPADASATDTRGRGWRAPRRSSPRWRPPAASAPACCSSSSRRRWAWSGTTAPTVRSSTEPTGFACPDTGGWCNPEFAGLRNQLYCRALGSTSGTPPTPPATATGPARNNVVQWHPNAGCGTSLVYIQNQATAGLYNYTPYRPNQRALDAGYGTGDSCSSYGNRNFWNFFTDWFGSTQSAGAGAIQVRHNELGGSAGWLGAPTTGFQCGLRDYGCFQGYQNGSIYWTPATGARPVTVPIRDKWALTGWELGSLGYPAADPICGLTRNGCFQVFQGGSVYWSPATGAHFVKGSIRDLWGAVGWELGALGYPTSDENCGLKDGGCFTHFERGSIYLEPVHGGPAHLAGDPRQVRGARLGERDARLPGGQPRLRPGRRRLLPALPGRQRLLVARLGRVAAQRPHPGPLGSHRLGDRVPGVPHLRRPVRPAGRRLLRGLPGRHGLLAFRVRRPPGVAGAAREVRGPRRDARDPRLPGDQSRVRTDRRRLLPALPGRRPVLVPHHRHLVRARRDRRPVERPRVGVRAARLSDDRRELRSPGNGCYQLYQNSSIYWSPATGEHFVNGAIRDAWAAVGWEAGPWGYPTANPMAVDGGLSQRFQNGTARWNASTGAVTFG